jgi:tetratricopeptide (TPR) repeat protein
MIGLVQAFAVLVLPASLALRQGAQDPELRAAVERFFLTQQTEDVDAYLALWSATVRPPSRDQLQYIFNSGDDAFSEIAVVKVTPAGDRVRIRVSAVRDRTEQGGVRGRGPVNRRSRMLVSLTYVREGTEWKLIREGPAVDDLALALIEAQSHDERLQLLGADPELLNDQLLLSLARRGVEAAQLEKFDDAGLAYARMLEVARHIEDRRFEAEALQNLGNTYYFQRNFPAALEAYEQRLSIERERGDDAGMAAALGGVATIRYSLAEYGAALTAYRAALAIHERFGNEAAAATTLISTGNVLYLQGDFDAAIADYRRSRELYRRGSNPQGEADALEGLGRVFLARGDYAGALEAFTGVLAEGRARNNSRAQGTALLNIGEIHFRLGNLAVARQTFEESRVHFESLKDAANIGRVWQAVALTDLVAGRFVAAESEYRRSIDSCVSVSDQECVAGGTVGLGFAQTAQQKFIDAIKSYRRAVEAFHRLRRPEQAARAEIGLAQALAGSLDYRAAVDAAVSAHQRAVAISNDDVLWRALVAEARALRRLEDRRGALAAANAARLALDRLVAASAVRPAAVVPHDSSSIFALLAVLHAENQDAAAAFEAAEQMRTHDLRVVLAPAEREIARGMTEAEREEERATSVELVTLHAQLTRERGLPKPDPGRIERLEQTVKAAEDRRAAQQARLFEHLPDLRTWRGLIAPAARADVATLLSDRDTVVVEFVLDDDDLLLISARQGEDGPEFSASVHEVERRTLADAVARLMSLDNLRSAEAWWTASREALDPVLSRLAAATAGASRVILIPHEILWRVPFEALPLGGGYLGSSIALTYAPSVTALVRTPPVPDSSTSDGSAVLVAGAPQISDALRNRMAQIAPEWTLRREDVADREMHAVAEAIEPDNLRGARGPEVSESLLRELMPAAGTLHLAAPFRVNGASPLFSPLLLAAERMDADAAAAPDSRKDGSLDAREIMNLSLSARVAVLSDSAALSMRDSADDVVMIAWAWRAAGVPHLLVARWPAEPDDSDRVLSAFHRRLRAGDAAPAALRAAQAALRAAGRSAPYHWAGWLLVSAR